MYDNRASSHSCASAARKDGSRYWRQCSANVLKACLKTNLLLKQRHTPNPVPSLCCSLTSKGMLTAKGNELMVWEKGGLIGDERRNG